MSNPLDRESANVDRYKSLRVCKICLKSSRAKSRKFEQMGFRGFGVMRRLAGDRQHMLFHI